MGCRDTLRQAVSDRECGLRAPRTLQIELTLRQKLQLEFNPLKWINSRGCNAGVNWLDLDRVDRRYLLAGCANGAVAAFDVLLPSQLNSAAAQTSSAPAAQKEHAPVFQVSPGTPGGHTFAVTATLWYPVDTGLFVTASLDATVKVWDSNAVSPVAHFKLESRVHCAAMSPLAHAHALIAVGTQHAAVRLCDARSGAFTHALEGHGGAVWAVAWGPSSQWQLATGACDGQVRMWDIRRSGCMAVLDQHDTEPNPATIGMPSLSDRATEEVGGGGAQCPLAAPSAAVAHDGRVTAVLPTPDGLSWLSAGTDSRVRVWSLPRYRNTLVNFAETYNKAGKARQLAVTEDSRILFHPSGSVVQVFRVADGSHCATLKGTHFDSVNCCVWNDRQQELYSGANDTQIHTWSPRLPAQDPETDDAPPSDMEEQDLWSDDD